jgi:hypothetical protein
VIGNKSEIVIGQGLAVSIERSHKGLFCGNGTFCILIVEVVALFFTCVKMCTTAYQNQLLCNNLKNK